jgi:hypothetical protein
LVGSEVEGFITAGGGAPLAQQCLGLRDVLAGRINAAAGQEQAQRQDDQSAPPPPPCL